MVRELHDGAGQERLAGAVLGCHLSDLNAELLVGAFHFFHDVAEGRPEGGGASVVPGASGINDDIVGVILGLLGVVVVYLQLNPVSRGDDDGSRLAGGSQRNGIGGVLDGDSLLSSQGLGCELDVANVTFHFDDSPLLFSSGVDGVFLVLFKGAGHGGDGLNTDVSDGANLTRLICYHG